MTMLDDDTLASLFARAGEAFEVPETGAADIVARALGPAPAGAPADRAVRTDGEGASGGPDDLDLDLGHERTVARRITDTARRHRIASVAACILLVLVLVGSVGALTRSRLTPATTSSLAKTPPPRAAGTATSTTLPEFGIQHAGGSSPSPDSAAAPQASGLAQGQAARSGTTSASAGGATGNGAPQLPTGAVGQSAKIEQTGTLGLTVARGALDRTMTELANLATTYSGFVANSQTQSGAGGSPYGTVTLQIPVEDFSAALKQAQALGKTASLSTKATDVTGQYVDLQSRIAALQDSRQQYLTIMAKATTVGDVLAVQAQLDTIQSQIEQLQGQLDVLTSETSYSTLTVTVSEGAPPPRPVPLPESGLVRAWHQGIGGFVGDLEGLIRAAGPALFTLLCLAALALGGRALWRRYQRHTL